MVNKTPTGLERITSIRAINVYGKSNINFKICCLLLEIALELYFSHFIILRNLQSRYYSYFADGVL